MSTSTAPTPAPVAVPEDAAQPNEVWQEADGTLLVCVVPGVRWAGFWAPNVEWDSPKIERPLRRLLDAQGNLVHAPREDALPEAECAGHATCNALVHEHGCYNDHGSCNDPDEHRPEPVEFQTGRCTGCQASGSECRGLTGNCCDTCRASGGCSHPDTPEPAAAPLSTEAVEEDDVTGEEHEQQQDRIRAIQKHIDDHLSDLDGVQNWGDGYVLVGEWPVDFLAQSIAESLDFDLVAPIVRSLVPADDEDMVRRVRALAESWAEADGETVNDHGLTTLTVTNRLGRTLLATLDGADQ